MSQDLEEEEDNDDEDQVELEEEEEEPDNNNNENNNEHERNQDQDPNDTPWWNSEAEEEEPAPFDPNPPPLRTADRTMRTDFATLGSSTHTAPSRFVNDEELDLIAAEVEERRSNRSNASSVGSGSGTQRARSRSRSPVRSMRATVEDAHEEEAENSHRHHLPPALPPAQTYSSQHIQQPPLFAPSHPEQSTSRPTALTAGHASRTHEPRRTSRTPEPAEPEAETPFPQIRGEHLERLFFSAPEHNAKTCTVCYRRRNRPNGASSSWSHVRTKGPKYTTSHNNAARDENEDGQEEDEGYEGSEGTDVDRNGKGKERERGESERERERQFVVSFSEDPSHWRQAGRKHGLPAQTVVARVIRELEDDFTHYKRCAFFLCPPTACLFA